MIQTAFTLPVQSDTQAFANQLICRLDTAGLQVVRSFDLKAARAAQVNCTCPHHGTDQCDCQMVVLLIYDQDSLPFTLVLHGHDGHTEIAFVDPIEQTSSTLVPKTIMQIILQIGKVDKKRVSLKVGEQDDLRKSQP